MNIARRSACLDASLASMGYGAPMCVVMRTIGYDDHA
jgi:hypothetical protein